MKISDEKIQVIIKAIGNEIAEKRKQMDITQPELAREVGISVNTMSNIERGEHPGNIDKIISLCYVLGISIDPIILGERAVGMPIFSDIFNEYKDEFEKLPPDARKVIMSTIMKLIDEMKEYTKSDVQND